MTVKYKNISWIPSIFKYYFYEITLVWTKLKIIKDKKDINNIKESLKDNIIVYAFTWSHGNQKEKIKIIYFGISTNPQKRFDNHPKINDYINKPGSLGFSSAQINITGKNKNEIVKNIINDIEHILIWSMEKYHLENDKKASSLPGLNQENARAYRILNTGYRFSGLMPLEILYPCILIKPGRDRSKR